MFEELTTTSIDRIAAFGDLHGYVHGWIGDDKQIPWFWFHVSSETPGSAEESSGGDRRRRRERQVAHPRGQSKVSSMTKRNCGSTSGTIRKPKRAFPFQYAIHGGTNAGICEIVHGPNLQHSAPRSARHDPSRLQNPEGHDGHRQFHQCFNGQKILGRSGDFPSGQVHRRERSGLRTRPVHALRFR